MRNQWQLIVASLVMFVASWVTAPQAEALILTFQIDKHPNDGQAFHPVGMGTDFNFVNALMTVNTSTGKADLGGSVVHVASGELWQFSGMFDGIGASGQFFNSLPAVPFDTMFDELLNNGNGTARIFYSEAQFDITPSVLNPAYTGPRLFVNNTNNTPDFGGEDLDIHRRIINQQPYLVIESGWWGITNVNGVDTGERSHGNWRWTMTETPPPPVIPEPMTSALFGLGALAGAIGPRARRKFSRLV